MTKKLCTICARGGSKGVKNKNIRALHGKPLLAHTIEHALNSELFDDIVVSSDSKDILDIAKSYNIYVIERPKELASDHAGKIGAIHHALLATQDLTKQYYDILVDLDATSPLRKISDINNAIKMLLEKNVSNVITATSARKSPYFNLIEINDGRVELSKNINEVILRRQESPKCYDMNASIYVWQVARFLKEPKVFYSDTSLYTMREDQAYDIDTELDFEIVEMIMELNKSKGI